MPDIKTKKPKILGYLSGAPRVSTRAEAILSGPRAHIMGVINAFEHLGWEVKTFIVGDYLPHSWTNKAIRSSNIEISWFKRFLMDVARLFIGFIGGCVALWSLRDVIVVYERLGVLQGLGYWFKLRKDVFWIIETNAILYREAYEDRNSLALIKLAKWLEKRVYDDCDGIVCVSEVLKDMLIQEFSIDPGKITVVPNGVDVNFFSPAKYVPKKLFERNVIGFVGALYPWHGLDMLIEVVAKLKEKGIQYHLVVVGDGEMRAIWETFADKAGLKDSVVFVGQVSWEEVPSYILGFDLCYVGQLPLASGKMYLSPLKLYEYGAMARPIVAAAYPDAEALIEHEVTGFLFDPGDSNSLLKALISAYDFRDEWLQMGKRMRKEILQYHSWEARISKLVDWIYDKTGLFN